MPCQLCLQCCRPPKEQKEKSNIAAPAQGAAHRQSRASTLSKTTDDHQPRCLTGGHKACLSTSQNNLARLPNFEPGHSLEVPGCKGQCPLNHDRLAHRSPCMPGGCQAGLWAGLSARHLRPSTALPRSGSAGLQLAPDEGWPSVKPAGC
eukprot:1143245-Pelagomonas_calceolata.AAC.10